MCSGIGSPEQSLKELGVPHTNVFACEKDKFARQTYLANFTPGIMYEDMTTEAWDLPEQYADLIVAGIPCQSFSLAGKRKGENDPRGLLIYDFIRYVKNQRPKVFIIENVKGLLSDAGGVTFSKWCDLLGYSKNKQSSLFDNPDSCGYNLYYRVLNAKHYGLPQNRERIFIIGIRPDVDDLSFRWPKAIPLRDRLIDLLETEVDEKYYLSDAMMAKLSDCGSYINQDTQARQVHDIFGCVPADTAGTHGYAMGYVQSVSMRGRYPDNPKSRKSGEHTEQMIEVNANPEITNAITSVQKDNLVSIGQLPGFESAGRIYDSNGLAKSQKCRTGGGGGDTGLYMVKEATKQGYAVAENGDSINTSNPNSKTRRGRVGKQLANTIKTKPIEVVYQNRIRRLTPLECMCLMGYPDDFIKPCSETQTYKQAGNSIPVHMMKAILRQLLPILSPSTTRK